MILRERSATDVKTSIQKTAEFKRSVACPADEPDPSHRALSLQHAYPAKRNGKAESLVGLPFRPRSLGFPNSRLLACRRTRRMSAVSVAHLPRSSCPRPPGGGAPRISAITAPKAMHGRQNRTTLYVLRTARYLKVRNFGPFKTRLERGLGGLKPPRV